MAPSMFDTLRAALRLVLVISVVIRVLLVIWLSWTFSVGAVLGTLCIVGFLLSLNYMYSTSGYHRGYLINDGGQLPPKYPSLIPCIGSALLMLWDTANFMRRATCYEGESTSTRISVLGSEIYAFQDREAVKQIIKNPNLSSPMSIYIYTLKYFFGMPAKGLATYIADNSGPLPKPQPGSQVPPQDRIDYILHHGFLRAWSGPGLAPTTDRFIRAFIRRTANLELTGQWTELPDFWGFFQTNMTPCFVEAIFGPTLIGLNPDFIENLWKYDDTIPWLARGVPAFLVPGAHKLRNTIRNQLKKWYAYSRREFRESCIEKDGDGDPYWGSELIRYRQKMLSESGNHDDDSLSSTDLGLVWATTANTIPSAMMAMLHIIKDRGLLKRLRKEILEHLGQRPARDISLKQLTKLPLLNSIYAETLRLHVETFFMVSSPHTDVSLGRWRLPKGRIGLVNSNLSHMDANSWNTKVGAHPVDEFWAERFLIDPSDPSSGPINPKIRGADTRPGRSGRGDVTFSTEGLEGSWIPYGGGHSICPGRFLARNVIFFTCVHLICEFDIELLTDSFKLDNWRFGLGVGRPTSLLPIRIRKRVI